MQKLRKRNVLLFLLRKGKEMRFEQALKAMREGKKVRLKDEDSVYFLLKGYLVCLLRKKSEYADEITANVYLGNYDIMSENWEIVEDEQKS